MTTQVSIITGSARGIGRATALVLAGRGTQIVLVDIAPDELRKVKREVEEKGGEALLIKADLSKLRDIKRIVAATLKKFGKVDLLVNNAGLCSRSSAADVSESEWDRLMEVNLKGTFFLSREALSVMKKQRRGKIINIASLAGKIGGIAVGPDYAASKAGVICLTKSLAKDAAPYGITVNCVCPGVIMTAMTAVLPKKEIKAYRKTIPLGRIGTPEDVANAVFFLASEKADYITGEILDVNGGLLMD